MEKWLDKIHHGNCIPLMRKLPPKSIDVIVTSPPYNLRNTTGAWAKSKQGKYKENWSKSALKIGYDGSTDDMPHEEYALWQRQCLTAMLRLIKPTGVIFYNHKWRVQNGLLQDRQDIVQGFPIRQIIIWKRKGGVNFNAGYFLPTYEVIYMIAGEDFKLAPKANLHGDVWEISQEHNNPHPAPFPIELAQRCIASTTGQIILDPFMGSGTTAIAAETESRDWIGFEQSQLYIDQANTRISNYREDRKNCIF